jgi:hypothetical protein
MTTYKLINFLEDTQFNSLRYSMGARLVDRVGISKISLLDEAAVRRLGKEGIDINDFSEIKREKDGTLSYKNKRVLVYIRDIKDFKDHRSRRGDKEKQSLPKFHLGFCTTLESMTNANRFGRYVVYNGEEANFTVNYIGPPTRTITAKLDVCKNCLTLLKWNNYNPQSSAAFKTNIVNEFQIKDFFEKYPKDLISILPKYTVDTAPLNDYSDDWGMISEKIKQDRGYQCESCKRRFEGSERQYLHGHHADGQKNNNDPKNIEILCLGCHAEEPMHSHMKNSFQYKEFKSKYG